MDYHFDTAKKGLEFGLYTLGDHLPDPHTGDRMRATRSFSPPRRTR